MPGFREQRRAAALERASLPRRHVIVDVVERDVIEPLESFDPAERPIDPEQIRRMARLHLSEEEIAEVVGMELHQLRDVYGPIIAQGRAEVVLALKRKRMEVAMRGNVPMLLHLSEQVLHERPAPRTNVNLNADLADDPKAKLLDAIRETTARLAGREVKALPSVQLAATDAEF